MRLTAIILSLACLFAAAPAPASAAATDSTSFDTWFTLCREANERGTRAQFDGHRSAAGTAFNEAVVAGHRAVVLAPGEAKGHLELAVALGNVALFRGGKEKVRLAHEVKSEVDRALALDPHNDRAHHVLARWNRGVAELNFLERSAAKVLFGGVPEGASMDTAIAEFEKAIALDPNYANHHLELGRTYLKVHLKTKAREEFEKALACPKESIFDADYKREAQQLMAKTK